MTYTPPRLSVHGSVENVTTASGNDGNDPCRFNNPRDTFKQTGPADLIQGNANLQTCQASA